MLIKISVLNLKFLCLIFGLISYTSPAYAYLDPGSGSMLLQALIAGLAAIIASLSIYWQKVKALVTGKKNNPLISEQAKEPARHTKQATDKNSNTQ